MKTTVINIKTQRERKENSTFIGRPSKWGNPFEIGKDGTREEVIQKYREWILTQPYLIKALPELKGEYLGCYCAPLACHGDVLVEFAEGVEMAVAGATRETLLIQGLEAAKFTAENLIAKNEVVYGCGCENIPCEDCGCKESDPLDDGSCYECSHTCEAHEIIGEIDSVLYSYREAGGKCGSLF